MPDLETGDTTDDDLTVLRCWGCAGSGERCTKCQATGKVFWVSGRTYPYTPEGERLARKAEEQSR